jgi:UDP-glucose 4-epimerase
MPLDYYTNNTASSLCLIQSCVESGVRNFIFSSTAAVYGTPRRNPVSEDAPANPISPYGRSKLMTERILEDTARAHDFRYVSLRYFNVAGADSRQRTGQSTIGATHLIKRACQVALGHYDHLDIFGTDFPTPDGTAIRDYIHVSDLVEAHILALEHIEAGDASRTFNCGYGRGFSVREVVDVVSHIAGHKLPTRDAPRRTGDPPEIVADPARMKTAFGWQPTHGDLETIVETAYAWEKHIHSNGANAS